MLEPKRTRRTKSRDPSAPPGHGRLSIFSAARMDGVGTMIRLLEEPQDPNQADPHGGRSALSAAAFEGA